MNYHCPLWSLFVACVRRFTSEAQVNVGGGKTILAFFGGVLSMRIEKSRPFLRSPYNKDTTMSFTRTLEFSSDGSLARRRGQQD